MKKAVVIMLFASLCYFAAGCCRGPAWGRHYKIIGGEEFLRLYNEEATIAFRFEYVGTKHGYYVLDYYDIGSGDIQCYRFSVRTPASEFPNGFPP